MKYHAILVILFIAFFTLLCVIQAPDDCLSSDASSLSLNYLKELVGDQTIAPKRKASSDILFNNSSAVRTLANWPQRTQGRVTSVMLADLDSDGSLEVIANSLFDGVYIWDRGGNPYPGWPFISTFVSKASPAIADVDGDGSPEIAVAGNYHFYLFRADGTLFPGWGGFLRGAWPGSPVLRDIDNDGDLEILAVYNAYGSTPAALYVWHHDGTLVSGWPQYISEPVKGSPAVADLDNDGVPEIILSGNFDHNVYVWRSNGELFPGWPQSDNEFSESYSSAAIGDIDNDGDMEIVSAGGAKLFVRNCNGTIADGWPRATLSTIDGSPALADVDRDGDLEIFIGSSLGGKAYAWHHDGTSVAGWPVEASGLGALMIDGSVAATPAIGDINGDGELDIIIASSSNHNVYAFNWNGVPLQGDWPKIVDEEYQYIASPAFGDIDGDGDIELAIGTRGGEVYVWDEGGIYDQNNVEWPMFRHDLEQTGFYPPLIDDEPPIVTITSPTWGETVNDKYQSFTFTVTDNAGISRLRIGMIGKSVFVDMALDGTASFSYTFDPQNLPDSLNPPANVTSLTLSSGNIDSAFPLSKGWTYYYGVQAWDTSGNQIFKYALFKVSYSTPGGGSSGCFLEGTPVLLPDGSTKAIEAFKAGDAILAYDEEAKEFRSDQVKHVFVFPEEEGYFVINKHIKVTPHHRFLVDERRQTTDDGRQWKEAGELKLGDMLIRGQTLSHSIRGSDPITPIASIEYIQEPVPVYNLEVNPYHTFIAEGLVVHNAQAISAKSGPISK